MRVLFLPRYGPLAGSSRYLIYDFLPYYRAAGMECEVVPLLDDRYLLYTQAQGRGERSESLVTLALHLLFNCLIRLWKIVTAHKYDMVVVEKELYPYLPGIFEWLLFRINPNVVSLYDDAMHVYYRDKGGVVARLVSDKVEYLMQQSREVVTWNNTLGAYAKERNPDVTVVTTGIDLARYSVREEYEVGDRPIRIGWMGTVSSFPYVHDLDAVFARLANAYNIELYIVSSEEYKAEGLPVTNARWSVATEINDLKSMDIGIMPLPNTPWAAGKSGCKMLQYMGVAVPVVVSPVGINGEIIQDNVNGRAATSPKEWYAALATLITHEEERRRLGRAGREFVVAHNDQSQIARTMIDVLQRAKEGTQSVSAEKNSSRPVPVLQVITRLILGGAQETVMILADEMDKTAWEAEIVSGIQTGPEGSLIEEVQARGVPLHFEPSLVREISPFKDVLALWRLYRLMRRRRYAVVHTNSSKAGVLGRWAAWLARTPVIVHTVHGWGHNDRQHPLLRAYYILIEKATLPITDKLIVVSPLDIEKGLRDGIGTCDDYVVIRSSVDLEHLKHPAAPRETTRAALGIPLDAPVVGSVTRLSPQKAPLDFVRSAAAVHAERPDVWFVMVGDGSLRPEVENLAAELGIRERLVLTGLRRDIPELLAAFDLFVLSSLWEGLPRVIIQAMASGLPVVATAADGTAEAVGQGVNGFLTPPGDPDALAGMVLQVLNNPELARTMGAAGLERVEEFSDRHMVALTDTLYRELLTKS